MTYTPVLLEVPAGWVYSEGPESGHTVTMSESAGSEVLKSLTPVENSGPAQDTANLNIISFHQTPKDKLNLRAYPEESS